MLIIWGKKLTYRETGAVAIFCPLCRDIQPMNVEAINRVAHVYYLSLGDGEEVGYRATCTGCNMQLFIENQVGARADRAPGNNLVALVERTQPALLTTQLARLQLERKLRRAAEPLTAAERLELTLEPFFGAPGLTTKSDFSDFLRVVGVLAFAALTLILPVWLWSEHHQHPSTADPNWWIWPWLSAFAGVAVLTFFYWLANRSGGNKVARAAILRALKPVNPSLEEIAQVLEYLRLNSVPSAKLFTPNQLHSALEAAHATDRTTIAVDLGFSSNFEAVLNHAEAKIAATAAATSPANEWDRPSGSTGGGY